jgi:ketosteroid isomerase-like protein
VLAEYWVTMSDVPRDALETRFSAAVRSGEQGPALEAIRESLQAFDARGADAVADDLHPDFELNMETLLLDGRVYHGIEGLRRWRSDITNVLEYDRFEPQAVRFAGENCVVVFGRLHAKGRASGVETDVPLIHVYETQDGKTRRLTMYSDAHRALQAVGLIE